MRRFTVVSFLTGVVLLCGSWATGCLDSSSGGSSDDDCPPGQVKGPQGECLRQRGGDDTGPDPGTDSTSDTGDDQTDRDVIENEECDVECGPDEFCLDGQCTKGAECEPNEPIGCIDGDTI